MSLVWRVSRGLATAALLAITASAARAQDTDFRVIVHSTNPVGALAREEVSKMFLKKIAAWRTGQMVVPVDQSEDADVRKRFSTRVLGRDVGAVKGYWQQAIFTGRSFPPVEKASDAEVIAFVAANPNSIGYVSGASALPASVKILKVDP
jgi:ABC-type phosphate transport system substrate-binding protein